MKNVVAIYEIGNDEILPDIPGVTLVFSAVASGVKVPHKSTEENAFIRHARWFNAENSNHFHSHDEYNWLFLRSQQTWCNDMLRARGHLFLNDAQDMLGLSRTAMGAVVGWVYEERDISYANPVDFGCWGQVDNPVEPENPDKILLDFNVQGPILYALG